MQEIEAKFLVGEPDLDRVAALERVGRFVVAGRHEVFQSDRYFDTPERRLAALGGSLRIRCKGSARLYTLKLPAGVEVGRRWEYEEPARDRSLEGWLSELAGREEIPVPLLAGPLQPVLEIENRRTALDLRSGEDRIEAALDRVLFRGPGGEVRGTELELELKAGSERALGEIAAALTRVVSLEPATESKYARALRLVGSPRVTEENADAH